jgi:hypothetical protein
MTETLCDRCDRPSHYVPNAPDGTPKQLCYRHYAAEYCPVSLVFHRDVPSWAVDALTSESHSQQICENWRSNAPPVTVHVFHRSEVETVDWKRNWEDWLGYHTKAYRPPYGYRGWCKYHDKEVVLLVDETETSDSLRWLFWHELGHMAVGASPLINKHFDRVNGPGFRYDWQDDDAHEACAEEQFVNALATRLVGGDYNRHWWRRRVLEQQLAAAL